MKLNYCASWSLNPDFLNGKISDDANIFFVSLPAPPDENGFIIYSDSMEPDCTTSSPNEIQNYIESHKVDLILTRRKCVYDLAPDKSKMFYFGSCWIENPERLWVGKTNTVSWNTTTKWIKNVDGYELRKKLVNNFDVVSRISKLPIHFYNSSREPVSEMSLYEKGRLLNSKDPLFRSKFSITIENQRCENWFTEKLIDCLQTKTLPIYYGMSKGDLKKWFNPDGILFVNSYEELMDTLEKLTPGEYDKRQKAIDENFNLSLGFAKDFQERFVEAVNSE